MLLSLIKGWSIAISSSWSVTISSFAAVKTIDARANATATVRIKHGRVNTNDTQSRNSRDIGFILCRFSLISAGKLSILLNHRCARPLTVHSRNIINYRPIPNGLLYSKRFGRKLRQKTRHASFPVRFCFAPCAYSLKFSEKQVQYSVPDFKC